MNKLILIIVLLKISPLFSQKSKMLYTVIDSVINIGSNSAAFEAELLLEKLISENETSAFWLRKSKIQHIQYNYFGSGKSIDKAIFIDGKNDELHFEKGLLLNKTRRLKEALVSFDKAINLKKIGVYYYWRAIVNQQVGKLDEAMMDYNEAISLGVEEPNLYRNYAIILSENSDFYAALKIINKSIKLNDEIGNSYSVRAKIYLRILDFDNACIDKTKAKKLGYSRPVFPMRNFCDSTILSKTKKVGELFILEEKYDLAIRIYDKLINEGENNAEMYLNRGFCYYKLGKYKPAELNYLKSIKYPSNLKNQTYINLQLLYFENEKYEKAIKLCDERIGLGEMVYEAYLDRGLNYRKLKKYKLAEGDFNKAMELKTNYFRAYGYRSFLYLEQGKYKKSLADAQKSIEINSRYAYGYIVLGQAKKQLGLIGYCEDFYNAKKYGWSKSDELIKFHCK